MSYEGKKKSTLCWDCMNACGGCNWSKALIPVEGWTAVKTHDSEYGAGYRVINCPGFIRDADESGNYRLSEEEMIQRTTLEGEEEIPDYNYG